MFKKRTRRNSRAHNQPGAYALLLILLLLLVACGGDDEDSADVSVETPTVADATQEVASADEENETSVDGGGTVRLLLWQAPTIVNPHLSAGSKDLTASRIVYEPLASPNADGELVPFLAAEIPSLDNGGVAKDGKSVTWTLRQDVKWSDGVSFLVYNVFDIFVSCFSLHHIPDTK